MICVLMLLRASDLCVKPIADERELERNLVGSFFTGFDFCTFVCGLFSFHLAVYSLLVGFWIVALVVVVLFSVLLF